MRTQRRDAATSELARTGHRVAAVPVRDNDAVGRETHRALSVLGTRLHDFTAYASTNLRRSGKQPRLKVLAVGVARSAVAGSGRDTQGSNSEPSREAVHRLRSRNRLPDGGRKTSGQDIDHHNLIAPLLVVQGPVRVRSGSSPTEQNIPASPPRPDICTGQVLINRGAADQAASMSAVLLTAARTADVAGLPRWVRRGVPLMKSPPRPISTA